MASALDLLLTGSQVGNLTKAGSLQAGQAAVPSLPESRVDVSTQPRVKPSTKPSETLSSFSKPVVANPLVFSDATTGLGDTRNRALQAFSQVASFAESGGSLDISE